MKLTIVSRSGKKSTHFPLTVDLTEDATVNDLKKAIHKRIKKFYPARQRLTHIEKVLDDGKKQLSDYGIKSEEKISFKDLGRVECVIPSKCQSPSPVLFYRKGSIILQAHRFHGELCFFLNTWVPL